MTAIDNRIQSPELLRNKIKHILGMLSYQVISQHPEYFSETVLIKKGLITPEKQGDWAMGQRAKNIWLGMIPGDYVVQIGRECTDINFDEQVELGAEQKPVSEWFNNEIIFYALDDEGCLGSEVVMAHSFPMLITLGQESLSQGFINIVEAVEECESRGYKGNARQGVLSLLKSLRKITGGRIAGIERFGENVSLVREGESYLWEDREPLFADNKDLYLSNFRKLINDTVAKGVNFLPRIEIIKHIPYSVYSPGLVGALHYHGVPCDDPRIEFVVSTEGVKIIYPEDTGFWALQNRPSDVMQLLLSADYLFRYGGFNFMGEGLQEFEEDGISIRNLVNIEGQAYLHEFNANKRKYLVLLELKSNNANTITFPALIPENAYLKFVRKRNLSGVGKAALIRSIREYQREYNLLNLEPTES